MAFGTWALQNDVTTLQHNYRFLFHLPGSCLYSDEGGSWFLVDAAIYLQNYTTQLCKNLEVKLNLH